MIKQVIKVDIQKALEKLNIVTDKILVEVPPQPELGDFSTNVAMMYAKRNNFSNIVLAQKLIMHLKKKRYYSKIEIKGKGFINFTLSIKFYQDALIAAKNEKRDFGKSTIGKGKKILLEFVSANPTGPLNIVSARAAAYGDTISCILKFLGYSVIKELYVNDYGNQVSLLLACGKRTKE